MIPAGTVIWSSATSHESIIEAKAFARENNLTPEEARIIKTPTSIIIRLAKPWYKDQNQTS